MDWGHGSYELRVQSLLSAECRVQSAECRFPNADLRRGRGIPNAELVNDWRLRPDAGSGLGGDPSLATSFRRRSSEELCRT